MKTPRDLSGAELAKALRNHLAGMCQGRGIYPAGTPALQIGAWNFKVPSLPNLPAD